MFSEKSLCALDTCAESLRLLFNKVVKNFDCSILEGNRTEGRQNLMFKSGKSQLKWPDSKHNKVPSRAVDVAPYPIDWNDRDRFILFAGYVLAVADEENIPIRWGGDWNKNRIVKDENFQDLCHFELEE